MKIASINMQSDIGGAARIARTIIEEIQLLNIESTYFVSKINHPNPYISKIDNYSGISKILLEKSIKWEEQSKKHFARIAFAASDPLNYVNHIIGVEQFRYKGMRKIISLPEFDFGLVHMHNLHSRYFDLRLLPQISHRFPSLITLHDEWLFTGHCAYSFDCERWDPSIGCGKCPNLSTYVTMRRDATRFNLKRKKRIYAKSHLNLVTPSQWLMDRVERSILTQVSGVRRVIHNGIDLSLYQPGDKQAVREALKIDQDAFVISFISNGLWNNAFKDFESAYQAVKEAAQISKRPIIFLAVGEEHPDEISENLQIRFIGFQEQTDLAQFYQASDLFIHATRADNYPTTIMEAMACAVPVLGTNIGGVPEQIINGQNGFLFSLRDVQTLKEKILFCIQNPEQLAQLSDNALAFAKSNFDVTRMVLEYKHLYEEIIENFKRAGQ
ncbi:MAG: glycosyltransferase [Anaerolineaceae bacterium]|nr:glycosyltransferase [Anaerolineaceae bacterium]